VNQPSQQTQTQTQPQDQRQELSSPNNTRHPFASFFHVFFKAAAIACYLIPYYFWPQYVFIFITVTTLLALDFWTVKNITGRLLVGLRWWNEIRPDGSAIWRFEKAKNRLINPRESYFFWMVLIVTPAIWIVFLIFSFIDLEWNWTLVNIVAVTLNLANCFGYFKCAKDARVRVQEMANSMLTTAASNYLVRSLTNQTK